MAPLTHSQMTIMDMEER